MSNMNAEDGETEAAAEDGLLMAGALNDENFDNIDIFNMNEDGEANEESSADSGLVGVIL